MQTNHYQKFAFMVCIALWGIKYIKESKAKDLPSLYRKKKKEKKWGFTELSALVIVG